MGKPMRPIPKIFTDAGVRTEKEYNDIQKQITFDQFQTINDLRPYLLKSGKDYTTDCLHYLGDLHQLLHAIHKGETIGKHTLDQYGEMLLEFKTKLDKVLNKS